MNQQRYQRRCRANDPGEHQRPDTAPNVLVQNVQKQKTEYQIGNVDHHTEVQTLFCLPQPPEDTERGGIQSKYNNRPHTAGQIDHSFFHDQGIRIPVQHCQDLPGKQKERHAGSNSHRHRQPEDAADAPAKPGFVPRSPVLGNHHRTSGGNSAEHTGNEIDDGPHQRHSRNGAFPILADKSGDQHTDKRNRHGVQHAGKGQIQNLTPGKGRTVQSLCQKALDRGFRFHKRPQKHFHDRSAEHAQFSTGIGKKQAHFPTNFPRYRSCFLVVFSAQKGVALPVQSNPFQYFKSPRRIFPIGPHSPPRYSSA